MIGLGKYLSLCLIVVIATPLLFVIGSSNAQTPLPSYIPEPTYPTPTIPEFTMELIGPTFTKPTTYALNESNGQIEAQIGYTNQYSSLKIKVKNQPFVPFDSGSNGPVHLMYNVRMKLHQNPDEWSHVYTADNGYPSQNNEGSTTDLTFTIEFVRGLGSIAGSQIDIQVQAMIGTVHRVLYGQWAPYLVDGQVSGWSNTQTISISANVPLDNPSLSPSPSGESTILPTATPNTSSSDLLLVIIIALVVISVLLTAIAYLLHYIRKQKNN
jgi:hypothetical protein